MLARAQKLLAHGNPDQAEALLQTNTARAAKDPRYAIVLSRIRESQWDFPGALSAVTESPHTFPHHAPTHLQRGIILGDLATQPSSPPEHATASPPPTELLNQSRAAFERVLELQPKNDLARSYLALTHFKLNDASAGAAIFRRHGFNDNRMFRVRVSEWIEDQWLRENRYFADASPESFVVPPSGGGADVVGPASWRPLLEPNDQVSQSPIQSSSRSDSETQNSELKTQNSSPTIPDLAREASLPRRTRENRGARAYSRHEFSTALELLEPLALSERPDPGATSYAASAAEMLNQHARGLAILDHLLAHIPAGDWPDQLIAARGRLLVRLRRFAEAAALLNRVTVVGPEDNGTNYYFAVLALAAGNRPLARRLFFRAHTQYLIDTLETQWWQTERALLRSEQ